VLRAFLTVPRNAGRWLLTLADLITVVAPIAADWNDSHIHNEAWPSLARFHGVVAVGMATIHRQRRQRALAGTAPPVRQTILAHAPTVGWRICRERGLNGLIHAPAADGTARLIASSSSVMPPGGGAGTNRPLCSASGQGRRRGSPPRRSRPRTSLRVPAA